MTTKTGLPPNAARPKPKATRPTGRRDWIKGSRADPLTGITDKELDEMLKNK